MRIYHWSGIDYAGKSITGKTTASNKQQVRAILSQENILVLAVTRKLNLVTEPKITIKHIAGVLDQLAILINANINLIAALNIIIAQEKHLKPKQLIMQLRQAIAAGQTFYQALNQYPQYFNQLVRNLSNVGEQSGNLGLVLQELAQYFAKMRLQRRQVAKALLYPAVVLLVTLMVVIILLLVVIPQFAAMYASVGMALPGYTQFVLSVAAGVKQYGGVVVAFMVVLSLGIKFSYRYCLAIKQYLDGAILKLPLIGNIINYSITSRLIKTIWLAFKAGVPLLKAIHISSGVVQNYWYVVAMRNVMNALNNGQLFHEAMQEQKIFSLQVVKLIAVGEETGTLEVMLEKIAAIYAQQLDYLIANLNHLLEPMIMLILGILVGGLVIGMYLPIFKLGMIM